MLVELRQIIGKDGDGNVVESPVDSVIFGGDEIGIIERRDGANMALGHWLSDADRSQLEKALNDERAKQGYTIPAKVHGFPVHPQLLASVMQQEAEE